jgi:hypothetical protein
MRAVDHFQHRSNEMNSPTLAAAIVSLMASAPVAAEEWKMSVTPYLWATDVGVDVSFADQELVDVTVPFEDLVEDIETVAQVRFEAMRGRHGVALDLFDVTLADEHAGVAIPDGSGNSLLLDSESGMTIFDATGIYNPKGDGTGVSLVYGVRAINQFSEMDATLVAGGEAAATASYDMDDTFTDALVGLRYAGNLPGNWSYEISADVSTGDTELTWSAAPAIGYSFGDRDQYRLTAGYRHMVVDFDTRNPIDTDMTLTGALIGFSYRF